MEKIHSKFYPNHLGKKLAKIRLNAAWTQETMAKRLGISKSHLCDIERGRKLLSPERASKFAKILKHSQEDMIEWALEDQLAQVGLFFELKLKKIKNITH